MTDEEYLFKQDVREKAITARSSHKIGSSRRRKCSLSTNCMTRKEFKMSYTENDLARFMVNELHPGDTFQFGCDMCGNCCRKRREPILMTGADIFRAARAIGASVEEILPKNFEGYVGDDSHVPLYVLAERLDGSCRFLRKGRCMIHQDKPAVCEIFPLGRIFNVQTGAFHYFVNTGRCHPGQPEGRTWTLEEWLDTFYVRETEAMTIAWHKLLNSLASVSASASIGSTRSRSAIRS